MTRLPAVGGDTDAWGTLLNDYLTETSVHSTLANSPTASATNIDLAVSPPGLVAGSMVVIDAYTSEAELRQVTGLTGNTITVAATRYAHAAGDTLLVLNDPRVSPRMYGAVGGSTDDWGPIQRMVLEAATYSLRCEHIAAMAGAVWQVSKPICVQTSSQWKNIGLKTHSSYAPVDLAGALCMLGQRQFSFTAAASTNVFTVAAGHGMTPGGYSQTTHTKIVFNNPYGETLPGGITAGKVYYIDTVPNSTTFTVSATKGGAALDVTSDGAGYGWESIEELARVYWDNVRFDVSIVDVTGARLSLQQPAYINNLRCEMTAVATTVDTVYGLYVTGQIGHMENFEVNPAGKCTGVFIGGTGLRLSRINCVGENNLETGVQIGGSGVSLGHVWAESLGKAGVRITSGRSIQIYGGLYHSATSGNPPAVLVDSTDCAYDLGPVYTSGTVVLQDDGRSLTFYKTGGTDPHYVVTDADGRFPGWSQMGVQFGTSSTYQTPPKFKARAYRLVINADYDVSIKDETVEVLTTGGSRTITLPPVASFNGYMFTIHNNSGGNSSIVIDTEDTAKIGGADTATLALGSTLTVVIANSGYHVIGTAATLPTYTPTNVTTDRAYDANATTIDEVADVLGTLIADLQARKVVG